MSESENELTNNISTLSNLLSHFSTEEVCIKAFDEMQKLIPNKFSSNLIAPEQQINYILGLALNAPASSQPEKLRNEDWSKICSLANKIFLSYRDKYCNEIVLASAEDQSKIFITMANYIFGVYNGQYFLSVEQLTHKIQIVFAPFNDEITEKLGLSLDRLISISVTITTVLQRNLDALVQTKEAWEKYKQLTTKGMRHKAALENACRNIDCNNSLPCLYFKVNQLQNQGLCLSEIESYLSICSQSQCTEKENSLLFPDTLTIKPLIKLSQDSYFTISGNLLFQALYTELEKSLIQDEKTKIRYKEHKARLLEHNTLENFKKIFGSDAQYYESLYEKEDSQYEHDLLIRHKKNLLIIECKTTPIPKQFRDVDKAYFRISNRFKDSIGEGLDQALNLKKLILSQSVTELYNKKGIPQLKITPAQLDNIFCICVTEQNEGILASNLSLLFKKSAESEYPYCINDSTLTQLSEFGKKLKITPSLFISFLLSQAKLHEKVMADDELDYWEYFLQHKNFNDFIKSEHRIALPSQHASIFDKAYLEKTHPGTEFFPKAAPTKIGRNALCPCGSEKKYKKCCKNIMI